MKTRWSSKSLGSRLQHGIFYRLIRLTGVRGAYALLFFVVSWYTLRPSVRARSREYLKRRFPDAGFFETLRHTWRLQWRFGQCLLDRAAAGLLGTFSFDDNARHTLTALAKEGNGLILLSAHTGCWQMAPCILAEHSGLQVSVLTHKDQDDIDKDAYEHTGRKPPYAAVSAELGPLAPIALIKALRQGQLLCMMGDRSLGGTDPAVNAAFLGSDISLPILAYRLASATGAPVLFVFALRTGPCRGRLCLSEVVRVPSDLGSRADVYQHFAQRFAVAVEAFSRDHPYQFFNFFNLWER